MILIFKKLPVRGIALYPFILLNDDTDRYDLHLLNHEKIHLRQEIEMLVLPFYIWYLLEYLWHRLKTKTHHEAYMKISFEKEAYQNDHNLNYLKTRPFWKFLKFI